MRRHFHWAFALLACSSSGGGEEVGIDARALCEASAERSRQCGVLDDGDTVCEHASYDGQEACRASCFIEASCEDLHAFTCALIESPGLPPPRAIGDCVRACEPSDACVDGDCPLYECADGTRISIASSEVIERRHQCNGEPDCEDGGDERGCEGRFSCASGRTVPDEVRCDGRDDCSDGDDEDDCPTWACEDGETILAGQRCDEILDCQDRSDEAGCAQLICGDEVPDAG